MAVDDLGEDDCGQLNADIVAKIQELIDAVNDLDSRVTALEPG